MSLSTQPYKGARDFYPADMRRQQYIFFIWRLVCQRFGYEEYTAPILEPTELFASKTSDEIVNEQTYTFTDRGNRSVTIRTEMTPSVSRMVAGKRQELGYPVRWFSMPNMWRYERTQRGRLREFWQLNVDLFGIDTIDAEVEMVLMADKILQVAGAKRDQYVIKINSRKLMDLILDDMDLKGESKRVFMRLLDKTDKMPEEDFLREAKSLIANEDSFRNMQKVFMSLNWRPNEQMEDSGPAKQIREITKRLEAEGVTNLEFDISLTRGFDYYTDFVFEVFDTNPENNRSMFGGGRYDGLVGQFGVEPVPTVGFAMGDITFQNFLESNKLMPDLPPVTELAVLIMGEFGDKAQAVVGELRNRGLNIDVDFSGRKLDKMIKAADKRGVPYVLFIGDTELSSGEFTLKELATGTEQKLALEKIPEAVKNT